MAYFQHFGEQSMNPASFHIFNKHNQKWLLIKHLNTTLGGFEPKVLNPSTFLMKIRDPNHPELYHHCDLLLLFWVRKNFH